MRTRVGYAGGTLKNPSYHDLGDHIETLQIDYDPSRLSYAQLLEVFWSAHNPCAKSGRRQYLSAIFTHSEEQKRLALETRNRLTLLKGRIATEILPAGAFTLAEDYHQKYSLRNRRDLMETFDKLYPDSKGFTDSTAAARVNACLAGDLSLRALEAELGSLDLPPEAAGELLRHLKGR